MGSWADQSLRVRVAWRRAESRQTHHERQVGSWTEEAAGADLLDPVSRSEAIFVDMAGPW